MTFRIAAGLLAAGSCLTGDQDGTPRVTTVRSRIDHQRRICTPVSEARTVYEQRLPCPSGSS